MYEEIIINCFRYLGFTSLYDIKILTLQEYLLRMKAYRLQQVDKEYDMHLQAWHNHRVTWTKEQGNKQVPVYRTFKEFFDYEKRLKEVLGPSNTKLTPKMRNLAKIASRVNSGKEV